MPSPYNTSQSGIYNPQFQDAAGAFSGVGAGLGQAMLGYPHVLADAARLKAETAMMGAHAGYYGAETDYARARTAKEDVERQGLEAEQRSIPSLGNALAEIAAGGGHPSPDQWQKVLVGMAYQAKHNPSELANAFTKMAATIGSGMMTNQPMAQAVTVGDRTYGAPRNVPQGSTMVDSSGKPMAYGMVNLAPGHQLQVPSAGPSPTYDLSAFNPTQPSQHMGDVWGNVLKLRQDPMYNDPSTPQWYRDHVDNIIRGIPTNGPSAAVSPVVAPPLNGPKPLAIPQAANTSTLNTNTPVAIKYIRGTNGLLMAQPPTQ